MRSAESMGSPISRARASISRVLSGVASVHPADEGPLDRRANKGRKRDSSPSDQQRTAANEFVASDGAAVMATMPVEAEQEFAIARCLAQNQRLSRRVT